MLFVFKSGRKKLIKRCLEGESPRDFLYGYELASLSKIVEPIPGCSKPWMHLIDKVFNFFSGNQKSNFAFAPMLQIYSQINKRNQIFVSVDGFATSIIWMKIVGLLSSEIIYLSQGLTNNFEKNKVAPAFFTKLFYRMAFFSCSQLLVFGEGARQAMIKYFNISKDMVKVVQFGVDIKFWEPATSSIPTRDYILSVGNDPSRDYVTLEVASLPLHLTVVSEYEFCSTSIKSLRGISDSQLRSLYQNAFCVIVPLQDVSQPSGQSVTLQAMACGTPVIITKTRGFWDSENFEDNKHVLFSEINNPDSIASKVRLLQDDKNLYDGIVGEAMKLVRSQYSYENMSEEIMSLSNQRTFDV